MTKATVEDIQWFLILCQCKNLNNEKNKTTPHRANNAVLPNFPENKAHNVYLGWYAISKAVLPTCH